MSRSPTDQYVDERRGIVVGRFHDLGKPAPRKDLCTLEHLIYDDSGDRRRKRSKSEQTRLVKQLWLKKYKEIVEGFKHEKPKPQNISLKEAADEWISVVKNRNSEETHKAYLKTANKLLEEPDTFRKLSDINEQTIANWIYKYSQDHTPGGTNKHIRQINAFLNYCQRQDWINKKPIIKEVKETIGKVQPYTPQQMDAILAHLESLETHNKKTLLRAYWMFRETGMRRSEVWSLPLDAIKSGKIFLMDQPRLRHMLKGRQERTIPITHRLREFIFGDVRGHEEIWYLDSGVGGLYYGSPHSLSAAFKKEVLKAIGPTQTKALHGIRAFVVTSLLAQGYDIGTVRHITGHSDVSVILNHYLHGDSLPVKDALNSLP